MNHSRKYILTGVLVSNLAMVFVGAFVFPWIWSMIEMSGFFPMALILLITSCSVIAGYFWSFTGISLKSLRLLAMVNLIWVWALLCFQPYFGITNLPPMDPDMSFKEYIGLNYLYIFTGVATLVITLFSSLLGNWFGRRFFYE